MNIFDVSKQAGVSICIPCFRQALKFSDSPSTRVKCFRLSNRTAILPALPCLQPGTDSMHTVGILCGFLRCPSGVGHLLPERNTGLRIHMLHALLHRLSSGEKKNTCSFFFQGMWMPVFAGSISWRIRKNNAYLLKPPKFLFFILNSYLAGDRIYSVLCDDRLVNGMTESLFRRGSHALFICTAARVTADVKIAGSACIKTE